MEMGRNVKKEKRERRKRHIVKEREEDVTRGMARHGMGGGGDEMM